MSTPTQSQRELNSDEVESLDLLQLLQLIARGYAQIIGLGLIGLATGAIVYLLWSPFQTVTTTANVVFSFPNLEKGQYPDESKFQPDDLRAPGVVASALERLDLEKSNDYQAKIRGAISIEGIITPEITKARERLRAEGQVLPPYIADEYIVSLTLPRKFNLDTRERSLLLNEIITVYKENFQHTYSSVPSAFGNVFETLQSADFTDYELILNKEIQNLTDYLTLQKNRSPAFRSVSTNLSFGDLLEQTQLFTQVSLDETLGQIYFHGISRNRQIALAKMDYYLHTLDGQENRAIAEEKVVLDLLSQSRDRADNYVLGIKSASTQPRTLNPILDQGLIDSLLANDSNALLVRRALDAGMKVKDIQAEKFQLLERKKRMESFIKDGEASKDQPVVLDSIEKSLSSLKNQYDALITNIRRTNSDYGRQEFADAVRISRQVSTEKPIRGIALSSILGLSLGVIIGVGLSLLGIYFGRSKTAA